MQTVRLDEGLYRTEADNGVSVFSEMLPGVRSVAVGLWVKTASVHEVRAKMGVSHLLEHMVFKGTERRSAHDIALELEVRGGSLDAFTSRDHTSYQARVLDEDLPRALDVLTDLVRNPAVPPGVRTSRRIARDSTQTHIVMGTDTFPYTDRRRHALLLLNTVLGAGMSSRLFQRVREELGLAYAVYSFQSFYRSSGLSGV